MYSSTENICVQGIGNWLNKLAVHIFVSQIPCVEFGNGGGYRHL